MLRGEGWQKASIWRSPLVCHSDPQAVSLSEDTGAGALVPACPSSRATQQQAPRRAASLSSRSPWGTMGQVGGGASSQVQEGVRLE